MVESHFTMTERYIGRSPEELHAATVEAFNLIPPLYSITEAAEELRNSTSEEMLNFWERMKDHGQNSELRQFLAKKLKDLVALSPTTQKFKKVMGFYIDYVCRNGKVSEEQSQEFDQETDATNALIEGLGIYASKGIYDLETAGDCESRLFGYVLNDFSTGIKDAFWVGEDPISSATKREDTIVKGLNLVQYKDLILSWHRDIEQQYGESPLELG